MIVLEAFVNVRISERMSFAICAISVFSRLQVVGILKNKIQLDATYYIIMRMLGCNTLRYSLWSGNSSILPARNFHPPATREPDSLCGNQCYHRELLVEECHSS